MRFSREIYIPARLSLFIFPAGLFVLLYIISCVMKIGSESTTDNKLLQEQQTREQQHTSAGSEKHGWPKNSIQLQSTNFNLMAETYGDNWAEASAEVYLPSVNCTIEYANANKLQQDHPCVIRLIRRNYLLQPAPKNLSYRLDHPGSPDPSDGQSQAILEILQNKTNGFFIECGGYDGEFLSNTLFMERYLGWSGLLIEADRKAFNKLLTRNRKAYTTPVCLSTELYPIQVNYNATVGTLSSILETNDGQQAANLTGNKDHRKVSNNSKKNTEDIYKVQCFPLYSILLAVGRTHVDYFGLDVEGSEYKILKTIPWQKIYVKTLTVEWNHSPEGEAAITRLMESNKFIKFGLISMPYSREVVYVRDFLDDYRKSKDE